MSPLPPSASATSKCSQAEITLNVVTLALLDLSANIISPSLLRSGGWADKIGGRTINIDNSKMTYTRLVYHLFYPTPSLINSNPTATSPLVLLARSSHGT